MKSLKEFLTENLEDSTITTFEENTEKQVDENATEMTVEENAEAEKTVIKK